MFRLDVYSKLSSMSCDCQGCQFTMFICNTVAKEEHCHVKGLITHYGIVATTLRDIALVWFMSMLAIFAYHN